jgi:hypothetical protein
MINLDPSHRENSCLSRRDFAKLGLDTDIIFGCDVMTAIDLDQSWHWQTTGRLRY